MAPMPDPTSLLGSLLVLLLAAVLIWFTFGTQRNISRGNRLLAWLQDGLAALGPRTTLRWLGSSVAELRITQPRHPYREALVLVVLEPRDLGALWAISRRRGRRDFLVLRLSLIRAPRSRVDLVDPSAWTAGDRRQDEFDPPQHEEWIDGTGRAVLIDHDGTSNLDRLRDHWEQLGRDSGGAWRVSVRPTVPHLEVHLLAPDPERDSARRLLDGVAELATTVAAH
jgi:hypothetical protein